MVIEFFPYLFYRHISRINFLVLLIYPPHTQKQPFLIIIPIHCHHIAENLQIDKMIIRIHISTYIYVCTFPFCQKRSTKSLLQKEVYKPTFLKHKSNNKTFPSVNQNRFYAHKYSLSLRFPPLKQPQYTTVCTTTTLLYISDRIYTQTILNNISHYSSPILILMISEQNGTQFLKKNIQINVPHFSFYVNTYFHMTFLSVQFIGKYSEIKCFTL